jgi:hypothetical protein
LPLSKRSSYRIENSNSIAIIKKGDIFNNRFFSISKNKPIDVYKVLCTRFMWKRAAVSFSKLVIVLNNKPSALLLFASINQKNKRLTNVNLLKLLKH